MFPLPLVTGALQIPCLNHPEDDNYEEIRQFFFPFLHCVYPSKGGGKEIEGDDRGKNERGWRDVNWGGGKE